MLKKTLIETCSGQKKSNVNHYKKLYTYTIAVLISLKYKRSSSYYRYL